jgi:hypothetical protein
MAQLWHKSQFVPMLATAPVFPQNGAQGSPQGFTQSYPDV